MPENYTLPDHRPSNCRFRRLDEGKPYPKSGCAACSASIRNGLACRYTETAPSETADTTPRLYTQADLDRAAQEARAVALQEAAEVARDWGAKFEPFGYPAMGEDEIRLNAACVIAAAIRTLGET